MKQRKRYCAECGTHRFGMIRHYVGFKQFCSLLCKELHKARILKEVREQKSWLRYLSGFP